MITVNQIAQLVNGTVMGDGDVPVKGLASYKYAEEGDATFVLSAEDLEAAAKSDTSCVITTEAVEGYPKTMLQVKDLKEAIVILYNAMREMKGPAKKGEIDPSASIAESAILGKNVAIGKNAVIGENTRIGDNASIGANCVIEKDVSIGNNTLLHPNIVVYDHVTIGNNVTIFSGTIIGADGFGFVPKGDKIYKVPQLCSVVIEDDVEIGANNCIDRGAFTDTVIGKGSKIDNLCQIAHNVKIGKNVLIAGMCGIAGSATIDDNTIFGAGGGVSDHTRVGKNVKVGAKSGITGVIHDNEVLFGYPARKVSDFKKLWGIETLMIKHYKKLKELILNMAKD